MKRNANLFKTGKKQSNELVWWLTHLLRFPIQTESLWSNKTKPKLVCETVQLHMNVYLAMLHFSSVCMRLRQFFEPFHNLEPKIKDQQYCGILLSTPIYCFTRQRQGMHPSTPDWAASRTFHGCDSRFSALPERSAVCSSLAKPHANRMSLSVKLPMHRLKLRVFGKS